ncbi:hypothetical protein V496_00416, partial [Pseudogymnoascus sp. VKM F-4515 (FW-2607)]
LNSYNNNLKLNNYNYNHNLKYLTYLLAKRRRVKAQRMNRVTKEVLKGWFDTYKSLIIELKIETHNTYNMDETGFSIGTMQSTRIIVDSTLLECICMDGTAIDPLIIFKGQNILQSWIPKEVIQKWHFSANTKGWTSNLHGLE